MLSLYLFLFAVLVENLPYRKSINKDLELHFEEWGKISEIIVGRSYKGMLDYYKELVELRNIRIKS